MNQKAFAIFIGAIMILSAFAGFVLRGGNETNSTTPIGSPSLETFGVQGRLIDWGFDSLGDMLEMSPEDTLYAYWINLSASQNLTEAARLAIPQSFGLSYGDGLYPTKIERLGAVFFNSSWAEFHWIRPFRVGYEGIVIPHEGYMMIPTGADYTAVMGRPTLFGSQKSVENVLDVISGGMPTNNFTLPQGELADLQIASLGKEKSRATVPLGGGYQEFYMGISKADNGYKIAAKYLKPDGSTEQKAKAIADKYGLAISSKGSVMEISGTIQPGTLRDVLGAFLRP